MENKLIQAGYETLIFHFRGRKVMVDSDLALLYDVPTKALKQQVRRNISRFPEDFMFVLTITEKSELVTNCDRLGICPIPFTYQGNGKLEKRNPGY